jgi:hypothetical protein
MRALILTTAAAVVLAFGLAPQSASAAWTYQFVSRFDPVLNRNVTVTEKVWVPDVVVAPAPVVITPAPVFVQPAPVVVSSPVVVDPVIIYRDRYHHSYDHYYYDHRYYYPR